MNTRRFSFRGSKKAFEFFSFHIVIVDVSFVCFLVKSVRHACLACLTFESFVHIADIRFRLQLPEEDLCVYLLPLLTFFNSLGYFFLELLAAIVVKQLLEFS